LPSSSESQKGPVTRLASRCDTRKSTSPRTRGKVKDILHHSRAALFWWRPESLLQGSQKTTPPPRPSSDQSGCGEPDHHDQERRTNERTDGRTGKIKGSRTPRSPGLPAAPCGTARTLRRARWPLGVPRSALARGTAGPQGSAPGHASGDSAGASGHSLAFRRRPRRISAGVTRAVLSPSSEHLTRRSLCRQDDARSRPSATVTKPSPASTEPRSASRSHRLASS
jgi:hypothetical protein